MPGSAFAYWVVSMVTAALDAVYSGAAMVDSTRCGSWVSACEPIAALLGDPSGVPAQDRNLIKARFPVGSGRSQFTGWPVVSEDSEATDRAFIADLRRASARYPGEARLAALIRRALDGNPRFAQLWRDAAVARHTEDRKTIRHPDVGDITVDCDVLSDGETDLKIIIYTAVPGSEDETKLDLTRIVGIRPAAG